MSSKKRGARPKGKYVAISNEEIEEAGTYAKAYYRKNIDILKGNAKKYRDNQLLNLKRSNEETKTYRSLTELKLSIISIKKRIKEYENIAKQMREELENKLELYKEEIKNTKINSLRLIVIKEIGLVSKIYKNLTGENRIKEAIHQSGLRLRAFALSKRLEQLDKAIHFDPSQIDFV